jgi:two-component system, chemotaxis family, response regulator Rcp1
MMVKTSQILLVEDNPGDVWLVKNAIQSADSHVAISVAVDGREALDFLRRENSFASSPRPDIIVLDLNLPRVNGREVLREIKEDPVLRTIPVVVLTSSSAEEDIVKAYELNANCYVTKPLELNKYQEVVRGIRRFWLETVNLPGNNEDH